MLIPRRNAHGKKHDVQGIVVELVGTAQYIVVGMFEAEPRFLNESAKWSIIMA